MHRTYAPYHDMDEYLDYVRALPDIRLTDDEAESMLAAGDRDAVCETLLKLVPFIAQRYIGDAWRRENYQDIIQEGNMAVWKCIDSWQPGKGMSIASWAYMYARKAMLTEMRKDIKYLAQHIALHEETDVDSSVYDNEHTDEGEWETQQQSAVDYRALRRKLASNRDKHILDLRREGRTQKEIAYLLGLSQSRIARLQRKLYKHIKLIGA